MITEHQNQAIADWMGLRPPGLIWSGVCAVDSKGNVSSGFPDYVNDLNAMRDAIAKIGDGQYEEFTVHLARASVGNADRGYDMRPLYEATAAQRAEALLKTLSLWKE